MTVAWAHWLCLLGVASWGEALLPVDVFSLLGFVDLPLRALTWLQTQASSPSLPIPVVEKETFLSPETLANFSHWLQSPDKGGDRLASLRQSRCIFRAGPVSTPSKPGWLKVKEREVPGGKKNQYYWSKRGVWGSTCVMKRWTIYIVYSSEAGSFLGYCGLGLWEGVAGFRPRALPRGASWDWPTWDMWSSLRNNGSVSVWQEGTRQLYVLQSYNTWDPKQLLIFAINCSSGSETGTLFWGSVEATRIRVN